MNDETSPVRPPKPDSQRLWPVLTLPGAIGVQAISP